MKTFFAFILSFCLAVGAPTTKVGGGGKTKVGGGGTTKVSSAITPSPALVSHTFMAVDFSGGTTSAINTTGANFIVVGIGNFRDTAVTVTDSNSNTWTPLTRANGGRYDVATQLFYCSSAIVGSGHTFTVTGSGVYGNFLVAAFSGVASTPFDVENGNAVDASGQTIQPGSVTPGQANELILTVVGYDDAGTPTIDSGFTITDAGPYSAPAAAAALAFKNVSSTSAVNPTWDVGAVVAGRAASLAGFKY